jgi:hypothetical protein
MNWRALKVMTKDFALRLLTNIHNIASEPGDSQPLRRSPRKLPIVNYGVNSGKIKSPSKCAKTTTSKATSAKKKIIPGM